MRLRFSLITFPLLLTGLLGTTVLFAASIGEIYTHGSFETAGVIIHLGDAVDGDETATLEYRAAGETTYRMAHPFVTYDGQNMASSVFNLQPATTYDIRVTLSDPDGVQGAAQQTATLTTRSSDISPAPIAIVTVAPSGAMYSTIQAALNAAQPGDEIRVSPGVYGPVTVNGLNGSPEMPIVVRADDPTDKPVIDGTGQGVAIDVIQSSHLVFDGIEVRNGGSNSSGVGVQIRASSRITVRNSLIHDNGRYEVFITQSSQFQGGTLEGGFHVIENNEIADLDYGSCGGAVNSPCTNQTYFGIRLDNNPGAGTVIRNNTIYDHVDNTAVCGDEGAGRNLSENVANVLSLTGGNNNQGWTNHNLEVYDNVMYGARDDDIEADGICVNARIFRNSFGAAQNPISIAPALPGPFFFVRNTIEGNGEASVKLNTAASPRDSITVPAIRNIFFYHNTIARSNQGTVLNLWYAVANDHNVPVRNIVFRNNVFWATAGGALIDSNNNGTEHPSFDFNLWYTPTTGNIFEWWSGSQTVSAQTLAEFRSISGQEDNGYFEEPGLDGDLRPAVGGGSAVVDRGTIIPGINDDFSGAAPDLGAFELAGGGSSAGVIQFAQQEYVVDEADGSVSIVVSRTSGNTGAVSVEFSVAGGSATENDDYMVQAGTLTWTNGDQSSKLIRLDLLDDGTDEQQETVELSLSNPDGGASLGAQGSVIVRINDNDNTGGSGGGGTGGDGVDAGEDSGGGSFDWHLLVAFLLAGWMRAGAVRRRYV